MARSMNPSVWIERRRTKSGEYKYRARAEADGRGLPSGPWMPKRTWAEEEVAKMKSRLWAGEREEVSRRRQMTWNTFVADYEIKRKQLVPETWRRFDFYALRSFGARVQGMALQAITMKAVQDWELELLKDGYSATTIGMWHASLSTAFNDAIAHGLIKKSPAAGVEPPNSDAGGRALKDAEISTIFEHAPDELHRAGQFALNTGLRIGEVTVFDWSMVEESASGAWFGRLPAALRKARQKVKKDCRFPINAAARAAMGPRVATGLVFPYRMNRLQQQLAAARIPAKIKDVSFHWFRHTFATRYLANGGHIEDLLETKLWADYRSLLRYVHLDDDVLTKRFELINLRPPSAQIEKGPTLS